MLRFFGFLTCLFFSFGSIAGPPPEIRKPYPKFRYTRTLFNFVFGGIALTKGISVLDQDVKTDEEEKLGLAMVAIGSLRFADGTYFLFKKTLPEKQMDEGLLDVESVNYQRELERAARFEKRLRTYRGIVILLNGIGFMRLYDIDEEKNKLLLPPGLGMFVVSTYALVFPGPAEKLLAKTQSENISWSIGPGSFSLSYRFP